MNVTSRGTEKGLKVCVCWRREVCVGGGEVCVGGGDVCAGGGNVCGGGGCVWECNYEHDCNQNIITSSLHHNDVTLKRLIDQLLTFVW